MPVEKHKILTIADVVAMGKMLIAVSNRFPLRYVTERDFFPLVIAYLTGRVPDLEAEVNTREGRVDFHLKGTNPTWLELAVQPREIKDKNYSELVFPGNGGKVSLYASQNRSELRKLMKEATGKTRFLLLLDLHGGYDLEKLKASYEKEGRKIKIKKGRPVRVVLVSQKGCPIKPFLVRPGGK